MSGDAIKALIRRSISEMSTRPFNWDGHGALPVRPDVLVFALDVLYADGSPLRLAGVKGLELGDVELWCDGTVSVKLRCGDREVTLFVMCHAVISWDATLPDAFIDSVIRATDPHWENELHNVLRMLAGPQS